jgi:hypothetical protein
MKLQAILRITLVLGLVHACSACQDVTIVCKPGTYAFEVSWQLQDKSGKVVAEQIGVEKQPPTNSNHKYGCDPGSVKTACLDEGEKYTIAGKDEYGDTWNGAFVAITFRGSSKPYMTFKGPTSGTVSNRYLDWASQSFTIPVKESSSSCVNVDVECINGGTYPYEVSWRVEQKGIVKAKGPPASEEEPTNPDKYGCIPGDKKRACLKPGVATLRGSDFYGDGWYGAKVKVTDVRTKKIYTEWSGPTNNPNTLDKSEYSQTFTIPTPAGQSKQYTIPSEPSKSMRLTWVKTKWKFRLFFKYGKSFYACDGKYFKLCKYVNGKTKWNFGLPIKTIYVLTPGFYRPLNMFINWASKKQELKSLSTTEDINKDRALNKDKKSFGNCIGTDQNDWHVGTCIDPKYEYCKGSELRDIGCSATTKCCKGCFAKCENFNCGDQPGKSKKYKGFDCKPQIHGFVASNAGPNHNSGGHAPINWSFLQMQERSLRRSSSNNKCNSAKMAEVLPGTKLIRQFLWNTVKVTGLNDNPKTLLKYAKHVTNGKSLSDLGVIWDSNKFTFNCCNEPSICTVVKKASTGTDQTFTYGATVKLNIKKDGNNIKWDVLQAQSNRRRLLSLMEGKMGRNC